MEVSYELTRKKTLKFFVEFLQKKGGRCTLHHLSSSFGNAEFTQEMRQMVKGSKLGVRNFLAGYPSIFTIEGDSVSIRVLVPDPEEPTEGFSVQETKEYFRVKLLTYLPCKKISIASLFGHRSQAPPNVRQICGKNPREFRIFLLKHPDTFSVTAEHVTVSKMEKLPIKRDSDTQMMKKKVQSVGIIMLAETLKGKPLKSSSNPGSSWKLKVLQETKVIASVGQCLAVTEAILKLARNDLVIISLDCEGVNLGIKGQLTVLQIATTSGKVFIFDIQMCPEMLSRGGLKTILESDNIVKIIHDCRNDAAVLYSHFGILLRCVLDTQAAHAVLQLQKFGKIVSRTKRLSLNMLCEKYRVPVNPMRDELKSIYQVDYKYWARRPLTDDMILYAASDVLVLINEQLYGAMIK